MPTKSTRKKSKKRTKGAATNGSDNEQHPIGAAISALLHRCEDIRIAATAFVPVSFKLRKKQFDDLLAELNAGQELLKRKTNQL